jgi:alpha-ribazole phosphatase
MMVAQNSVGELTVYLVRHPAVHSDYKGICYGDSDVELELGWEKSLESLVAELQTSHSASQCVIWHSDLKRCSEPARWIANRIGAETRSDHRLRERYFGTWQSVAWSDIPSEEVERSHEMLEHPAQFRPGGGETTDEVIQRALAWWHEATTQTHSNSSNLQTLIAVAHSGSITSLCGTLLGLPPMEWTPYYLKPSQHLVLNVYGRVATLANPNPTR